MLLERVFGPDAAAAGAVIINIVAVLLLDSTPKIAVWVRVFVCPPIIIDWNMERAVFCDHENAHRIVNPKQMANEQK